MTDIDDLLDELKQKRDELRVQIDLASKEARDEWRELEKKMDEFAHRAKLKETGEGVGKALQQVGEELQRGYERIREALRDD
jgi:5'-deoxynucleotidase YfbR-like HD superfamily hydrolase